MRKLMAILSGCAMLSCQTLAADWCDWFNGCNDCDTCEGWPTAANICTTDWPPCFKLDIGGGYRQDRFKWSIAGVDFDNALIVDDDIEPFPNTASELQWKELRICQIGGNAHFVSCRNYVLYAAGEYGQIYHGHVVDADYLCNDKECLFSLTRHQANKGHVYDLAIAAGYRAFSTCGRFIGKILAGYSRHSQYLHMDKGRQIFLFAPCDFQINVHNTYTTRWYGPWIGVDFEARVERCAFMFGGFEWHMLAYRGHGNWNGRQDIRRFDHKAPGWGYVARLGGKWEIWDRWSLGVVGYYRMFRTKKGHENLCLHDPLLGDVRLRLRFNGANWHNYGVSGIISWRF